ncbi:type II secretion system protein GspM [Thioalkalivibrio sp.]|uniref:type II secretion system protein GspM n=1 Tax=Thioalkalivibrio sp. TaxID=2093813 RepID=UPI003976EDC8
MMTYWNNLQPREQRVLLAGGAVLLAVILFLGLVEPLLQGREEARDRLAQAKAELSWMQAHAPEVATARGAKAAQDEGRPPLEGRSLIAHVDASARAFGLSEHLASARPGERDVSVDLKGVSYTVVMNWLSELEQQGVAPERVLLERVVEPGRINAELLLTRQP